LQIRDARRFVESRLEDLSALWDGEPRIAREEIAKHLGKITLNRCFAFTSLPEFGIASE
jgi:hypothetical protein